MIIYQRINRCLARENAAGPLNDTKNYGNAAERRRSFALNYRVTDELQNSSPGISGRNISAFPSLVSLSSLLMLCTSSFLSPGPLPRAAHTERATRFIRGPFFLDDSSILGHGPPALQVYMRALVPRLKKKVQALELEVRRERERENRTARTMDPNNAS